MDKGEPLRSYSFKYTLSSHPLLTPSPTPTHHTLSSHPLITPSQHTLSSHPMHACFFIAFIFIFIGRLALVCLRSWRRWRMTRVLQQRSVAAAGRYFLQHRVAKARGVRQWRDWVRRRRAARATSAVGLDAVPGLFKRLSKAYTSVGDSESGGGGSGGSGSLGGVSYALQRDRKGVQQRKKQKRISDLHQVTSHHIISYHITSCHITSHHITSHHITSHHITSPYITPHHITPSLCVMLDIIFSRPH